MKDGRGEGGLQALLTEAAANHTRGNLEGAERGYRAVLAQKPGHFDALQLLGAVLAQTRRAQEAVEVITRAIAINPGVAETHNNLGYALDTLGRGAEAIESYRRALALRPGYADAHRNLGNALWAAGQLDAAIGCYREAARIDPGHAGGWKRLGSALRAAHRHDEAIAAHQQHLAIKPDDGEALVGLGQLLVLVNRGKEAADAYRRAIALRPDHADAHGNLGNLLQATNHYGAAIASFEAALAASPGYPYAPGMVANCSAHLCDWRRRPAHIRGLTEGVKAGEPVAEPLVMIGITDDPAIQLACAGAHARRRYPPAPAPLWRGERYRHERIRVAYLSADFRDHPVARLTVELFERHDRERFDVTGVYFGPDSQGALRERVQGAFERYVDMRVKSDAEIAAWLRESEIDIAVDLMGYTQYSRPRILACRPAPVQVSYLGFPATMGAGYIDYILADAFLVPEGQQAHYSEKVVYLPSFQANTHSRIAERVPTRDAAGLPKDGFVFCCFNNTFKITPEFFEVWMRVLKRVEGSVLWLLTRDPATMDNLKREAQARGVGSERLVFAARASHEDHLARYRLADLFLDTLPVNAGTTASDALWAGVPVLTCAGRSFAGRMAGSLLNAIGLPELITHRLTDYEALAVDLATQPGRHRALREKLAANRLSAPLFDVDRFRRHIEAAYRTMWEIAQRGEPPRSFAVESPVSGGATREQGRVDLRSLLAEAAASHGRGDFEGAERGYRAVLAGRPDDFDALQLLGTVLAQTGRAEEAVELIGRALAMRPKVAEAHNNLGYALNELRRTAEAVDSYRRALALKPDYPDAQRNLGAALISLGRSKEAIDCLRKAAATRPGAEVHNSLGNAYRIAGRHEEAAASFEAALAADPARKYAPGMVAHCSDAICDWRERGPRVRRVVDGVKAGKPAAVPMALLGLTGDPGTQLACAAIHARDLYPAAAPLWRGERYRHDRIRVAYLSADFRDHAVAWLTAELFERHDRAAFETWGVSFGHGASAPMRKRLEAAFERFTDVRAKSDAEVAALLRGAEVDIVVDLMGFTQFSRPSIVARRPAPVQVSYLGFPATMGAGYIDYIIADAFVIPPGDEQGYAEKVARLPDTFQANDTRRKIAKRTPSRAEAGLPERGFVYCCFNNSHKITPGMFDAWMRVLKAVDGSVLWLVTDDETARANLRREAKARGVAPGRLVFAARVKQEDYLARYRIADLFLDTLPFNAGATASDALWAGLPVLTCAGSSFAGRMAGSLLHAIGLPELVTHRLEDYEALAVELGTHPQRIHALKEKLAANRLSAPLFDVERYSRHIEAAYRTMREIAQRGEPPRSFAVEPLP